MNKICTAVCGFVLVSSGCLAAATSDRTMGNWEGTYTNSEGGTGEVAAKIIARGAGKYDGFFIAHAGEGNMLRLPFRGETKESGVQIIGKVDLGSDHGGVVTWEGVVADEKFIGSYKDANGSGKFALNRVEKKPDTLGKKPPEGAVVLFDGSNLDAWLQTDGKPATWKIVGDAMEISGGSIATKQTFGDMMIHIEFKTPFMPEARGQARGNSGVYVHGRYEVQVLDSFGEEPRDNEAGGIYQVAVPKVNAALPPGEWQTYDITFHAPKYEGKLVEPGEITVVHNGEIIHDRVKLSNPTPGGMPLKPGTPGGIMLQDHGNPVQYRNIWVKPLGE